MKILIALAMCVALAFCASTAYAGDFFDNFFDDESRGNTFRVGVEVPELVEFAEGHYLSVEVSKGINNTNSDEDYEIFAKYTIPWTANLRSPKPPSITLCEKKEKQKWVNQTSDGLWKN